MASTLFVLTCCTSQTEHSRTVSPLSNWHRQLQSQVYPTGTMQIKAVLLLGLLLAAGPGPIKVEAGWIQGLGTVVKFIGTNSDSIGAVATTIGNYLGSVKELYGFDVTIPAHALTATELNAELEFSWSGLVDTVKKALPAITQVAATVVPLLLMDGENSMVANSSALINSTGLLMDFPDMPISGGPPQTLLDDLGSILAECNLPVTFNTAPKGETPNEMDLLSKFASSAFTRLSDTHSASGYNVNSNVNKKYKLQHNKGHIRFNSSDTIVDLLNFGHSFIPFNNVASEKKLQLLSAVSLLPAPRLQDAVKEQAMHRQAQAARIMAAANSKFCVEAGTTTYTITARLKFQNALGFLAAANTVPLPEQILEQMANSSNVHIAHMNAPFGLTQTFNLETQLLPAQVENLILAEGNTLAPTFGNSLMRVSFPNVDVLFNPTLTHRVCGKPATGLQLA